METVSTRLGDTGEQKRISIVIEDKCWSSHAIKKDSKRPAYHHATHNAILAPLNPLTYFMYMRITALPQNFEID